MIALLVVVAALAGAALAVTAGVIASRRQPALERRLAGYEPLEPEDLHAEDDGGPETAVVQQAMEFTGRLAQRTGILERVERNLEQAALPVRAGEVVFYVPAFAILAALLVLIIFGPVGALITLVAAFLVPIAVIERKKKGRTAHFERQLPDALTLLASSLRAGFAFMQGLESVAQEIGEPMRSELQRVFTEVRLGRAVEDALTDAAERMQSRDLAWATQAIRIQREVGGNLASLLDTVADTMRKREQMRRELKALTAEGRMSAVVLSVMPLLVGVGLWLLQPKYIEGLFDSAVGIAALIGAGVMTVIGWFWLRRIVDIEV